MKELIYIKCPVDGTVLSLIKKIGIENSNIRCPKCGLSKHFSLYERVEKPVRKIQPSSGNRARNEEKTCYLSPGGKTEFIGSVNNSIGIVRLVGSGVSYQLKAGRNVIGRKSLKSNADFQIEVNEGRSMSREHLVIEVKKKPTGGFGHYVSLYKEQVNKTSIGKDQLHYGDCIVLKDGDLINLPDAVLRFEIPDDERTIF